MITRIDVEINHGGLAPIAASILSVLGAYFMRLPIPPDKVEAVGRRLGALIGGSWESVVNVIIANIAIRV
ncbi:MAG: hypothetical protein QM820_49565 [Minicystis sp.]